MTKPGDFGMSSKVIVKKNLIIFKNKDQWDKIWQGIVEQHGAKIGISFVCRRELGFTVRHHTEWIPFNKEGDRVRHYAEEQIHLDFYNESTQSWFLLRYLNISAGADTQ
jgi:hypothetical protein